MKLALTYHSHRDRIKRIINARRKLKHRLTKKKKTACLSKMLYAGLHFFSHVNPINAHASQKKRSLGSALLSKLNLRV